MGVIKSFLHCSYAISSWREAFRQDLARIKQLLVNNNFPMAIIDNQVNQFLEQNIKPADVNEASNNDFSYENIYFQNQMSATYKQDETQLKKLIEKHLKPTKNDTKGCFHWDSESTHNSRHSRNAVNWT